MGGTLQHTTLNGVGQGWTVFNKLRDSDVCQLQKAGLHAKIIPRSGSHLLSTRRKLLLITASSPSIRKVRRARVLNFQQITMPYLAAFVPANWEVIHVDEAIAPVDVTLHVDLVGITFHTPSAPHVYDLATQFRRQGVPVVLGGPHV